MTEFIMVYGEDRGKYDVDFWQEMISRETDSFTYEEKKDICILGLTDDNRILYSDIMKEIIVIDDVNKQLFSSIDGSLDDLIEGILDDISNRI